MPWLGRDFFPGIKSGEIDMHFRAPIGLRLEEAGKVAALVDGAVATLLPGHVSNIIDNCGLPISGINQAYSASATIGPQDCDVTIGLNDPGLAGRRVSGDAARSAAEAVSGDELSPSRPAISPQRS